MNYASDYRKRNKDNSQLITLALHVYIVRDKTSWILEGSESNNLDSREFRRAHWSMVLTEGYDNNNLDFTEFFREHWPKILIEGSETKF
jgi:hypothetical protein